MATRIAATSSHGCESPPGAVVVTSGGTGALVIAVVGVPVPSVGGDVGVVGTVVTIPGSTSGTSVGSPGSELPPGAVPLLPAGGGGAKRGVQPSPASQISGQACALCDCTWNTPSCGSPGVNPTATRDGMPSDRAMTAYVLANWTQKPRLSEMKLAIAFVSSRGSTSRS